VSEAPSSRPPARRRSSAAAGRPGGRGVLPAGGRAGRRPLDRAGAGAGQGRVGARVPGRGAEATAIYAEAIPVLLETDEITAGEALRRLSSTAWALGDAEAVPGECTRGDRGADAASGPGLVRAYGTAALNEAIAGRVQEAETLYDTGFEEAARLGIEDVGVLLHARASVRGYQATRAVSKTTCVRRATSVCASGSAGTRRSPMNNLADGEAFYVGLRQARETWEQAIQFSRERGITAAMMWQRGERAALSVPRRRVGRRPHGGRGDPAVDRGRRAARGSTRGCRWQASTSIVAISPGRRRRRSRSSTRRARVAILRCSCPDSLRWPSWLPLPASAIVPWDTSPSSTWRARAS
jgi:hypothetical protein